MPKCQRPPVDIPPQSPVEAAAAAAASSRRWRSYWNCPRPPMTLTTTLTCCASSCRASPRCLMVANRLRCFHVNVFCHCPKPFVCLANPSSYGHYAHGWMHPAVLRSCVWHVFRYQNNIRIKLNIILMHLSVVERAW